MKIGITGADGQLGTSLTRELEGKHDIVCLNVPGFDLLSNPGQAVHNLDLDVLIHGAAMTDVDGCTADPGQALRVNGWGTGDLANACAERGVRMIYISSNEVFPGNEEKTWYEYDHVGPVNAYGRSKLAGEELARASGCKLSIVRLSWVFGPGFTNFPSKMCELADRLGALKVVSDEIACPSYAPDIAVAIHQLIGQQENGVFHLCNEGAVSRYEFAKRVFELTDRDLPVDPIPQASFDRPSQPPLYTPMGNEMALSLGIQMRPWSEALEDWARAEKELA